MTAMESHHPHHGHHRASATAGGMSLRYGTEFCRHSTKNEKELAKIEAETNHQADLAAQKIQNAERGRRARMEANNRRLQKVLKENETLKAHIQDCGLSLPASILEEELYMSERLTDKPGNGQANSEKHLSKESNEPKGEQRKEDRSTVRSSTIVVDDDDSDASNYVDPDWSDLRVKMGRLVTSQQLEVFMGLVIISNVVVVIRETDLRVICEDFYLDASSEPSGFCELHVMMVKLASRIMLGIYTVELTGRMFVFRSTFFFNYWNCFDVIVVIAGILSEILDDVLPNMSIIRIFRIARLARIIRLVISFRELYLIVSMFVSVIKTLFWSTFLLFLLLSVCSIVAVEYVHPVNRTITYHNCDWCPRAFDSVMKSNLTLFQTAIVGDGWGLIAVPLTENQVGAGLLLVFVVILVVFGFFNLIMAVIVEKAMEARVEDERFQLVVQEKEAIMKKERLCKLCADMDDDGSGDISLQELMDAYDTNRKFLTTLRSMKIEKDDIGRLFKLCDMDNSGVVEYEHFAEQVHKMKTSDTSTMLHWITQSLIDVGKDLRHVKMDVDQMKEVADANPRKVLGLSEVSVPPAPSHASELHGAEVAMSVRKSESTPQAAANLEGGVPEVVIPPAALILPQAVKLDMARSEKVAAKCEQAFTSELWNPESAESLHERFFATRQRIQEQLTCITTDAVQKADAQGQALLTSVELLSALEKSLPMLGNSLLVQGDQHADASAQIAKDSVAAQLLQQPASRIHGRPPGKASALLEHDMAPFPSVRNMRDISAEFGGNRESAKGTSAAADPLFHSARKRSDHDPCCVNGSFNCT